jgi:hypothetical protein
LEYGTNFPDNKVHFLVSNAAKAKAAVKTGDYYAVKAS